MRIRLAVLFVGVALTGRAHCQELDVAEIVITPEIVQVNFGQRQAIPGRRLYGRVVPHSKMDLLERSDVKKDLGVNAEQRTRLRDRKKSIQQFLNSTYYGLERNQRKRAVLQVLADEVSERRESLVKEVLNEKQLERLGEISHQMLLRDGGIGALDSEEFDDLLSMPDNQRRVCSQRHEKDLLALRRSVDETKRRVATKRLKECINEEETSGRPFGKKPKSPTEKSNRR